MSTLEERIGVLEVNLNDLLQRFEKVEKFNPYHDPGTGRFSSGGGRGGGRTTATRVETGGGGATRRLKLSTAEEKKLDSLGVKGQARTMYTSLKGGTMRIPITDRNNSKLRAVDTLEDKKLVNVKRIWGEHVTGGDTSYVEVNLRR